MGTVKTDQKGQMTMLNFVFSGRRAQTVFFFVIHVSLRIQTKTFETSNITFCKFCSFFLSGAVFSFIKQSVDQFPPVCNMFNSTLSYYCRSMLAFAAIHVPAIPFKL